MNHRLGFISVMLALLWPCALSAGEIAPGVDYTLHTITMSDGQPNRVHVVAIDRNRPEYKWKVGWAQKKRQYTAREATSMIANRYHLPGTHEVLTAVNASFFDPTNPPRIIGIGQTAGEMLDVPGFGAATDHTVMVGAARSPEIVSNFLGAPGTITFADGFTTTLGTYNWNASAPSVPINNTAAFTPHFNSVTPTFGLNPSLAVEVVLSDVSYPMRSEKEVSGIVQQIITSWPGMPGNTPIPPGGMVLCGNNTRSLILAHTEIGDRIRVKAATASVAYNNADNAVTGSGWIIHNGAAYPAGWQNLEGGAAPSSRHPRTMLAWNHDTWFMVVCDGRTSVSVGMTFNEMATFLTGTLGALEAVNFDGGGSSTMVVNGAVVNAPSDGSQRPVANAMLLVKEDTATPFPVADPFAGSGRIGGWDDKFMYADVIAFSPAAPGGDGHVIRVGRPAGGADTMRRGDFGDTDYSVQADLYCEYRPDVAGDGYERYALFARDSGAGALGLSTYGGGNCYAMVYDSHSGQLGAGKYVNGAFTDLLAASTFITESGWRQFRIDAYGDTLRFRLDGSLLASVTDTTFTRGYFGIGHHSFFTTPANIHGTRADNFLAFVDPAERLPDFDDDGDVDMTDFGMFQICLNGSLPVTAPECNPARLDGDQDVDGADMMRFMNCLSGPDIAPDPACLP